MIKSKRYRKRKTNKPSLARQVAVLKKTVATRAPERKYYDVASTSNSVDNLPSINITPYRQISQGLLDYGNRIGDKIRVSPTFRLKTTWLLNGATPVRIRMFAFIYKQNPDAINSTWATVVNLYLSSAYMNSVSAVLADRDHDNAKSFVTLYDKTRVMNPNGENTSAKIQWDVNLSTPSTYQNITYYAGGTSITHNELYIGFLQEFDSAVTVDYHYRYYYIDT